MVMLPVGHHRGKHTTCRARGAFDGLMRRVSGPPVAPPPPPPPTVPAPVAPSERQEPHSHSRLPPAQNVKPATSLLKKAATESPAGQRNSSSSSSHSSSSRKPGSSRLRSKAQLPPASASSVGLTTNIAAAHTSLPMKLVEGSASQANDASSGNSSSSYSQESPGSSDFSSITNDSSGSSSSSSSEPPTSTSMGVAPSSQPARPIAIRSNKALARDRAMRLRAQRARLLLEQKQREQQQGLPATATAAGKPQPDPCNESNQAAAASNQAAAAAAATRSPSPQPPAAAAAATSPQVSPQPPASSSQSPASASGLSTQSSAANGLPHAGAATGSKADAETIQDVTAISAAAGAASRSPSPKRTPRSKRTSTRDWLKAWKEPAQSSTASLRGNTSSSVNSGAGLGGRFARTASLLSSWQSEGGGEGEGRATRQGGGLGSRGRAGGLAVAHVGPQIVMARDGSWQLQGCQDELDGLLKCAAPAQQERLLAAVRAEQEAEGEALRALYTTNLKRLQREGVVLTGLRATRQGQLFRSTVWRFSLPPASRSPIESSSEQSRRRSNKGATPDEAAPPAAGGGSSPLLPYHKFRASDNVLLSRFSTADESANLRSSSSGGGGAAAADTSRGWGSGSSSGEDEDSVDGLGWVVEGAVLEARRDHVLVALDRKASDRLDAQLAMPGAARVLWRLDQSVKDVTAARQKEAIVRLTSWSSGNRAQDAPPGEVLVRLVVAASSSNAPLIADQPPLWVRDPQWRDMARAALASQTNLNSSQRRAVAQAMVKSFTLWQGPPGTGKTRTLLALVCVFLATTSLPHARAAMGPLLACADTNAAADNLVQGLVARGVRVVRVGNPAKVRAPLRAYTVEAVAESSTAAGREAVKLRERAMARLNVLREEKEALAARIGLDLPASPAVPARSRMSPQTRSPVGVRSSAGVIGAAEANARADLDRADVLLRNAMDEVLASAQVVCSTCTGAGDPQLAAHTFRVVVLDEATQATEPAVLVPLTRGAQCVVMAGDPQQLPPTVVSQKALSYGLDVTLFDRVAASGVTPLLLDTQYRMHPAISAFPSQHFYGGQLRDGVQASDKPIPLGFPWPVPQLPVAFVEVEHGREERANVSGGGNSSWAEAESEQQRKSGGKGSSSSGGGSYKNMAEAKLALQVVHGLVQAGGVASVAILTPYRGQVRALESLMRTSAPHLLAETSNNSGNGSGGGVEVTVSSVDAYQGREADVVVFSAVRCNRNGSIGFVSDPRRLNVGITRPRRGLILIGSPSSLAAGSKADWAPYLDWLRKKGVCLSHEAVSTSC